MTNLPSQPNQSLLDGLRLLEALAGKPFPVSCTSLSLELGMEVTRVNRLVKTLHAQGFAYRNKTRHYGAGPGLFVLSAATLNTLGYFRKGIDALERLSRENLVTAMGVLWREKVSYLFHWSPGMAMADAIGKSSLVPATQSSIGLVLMAQKSDDEVRALYEGHEIPRYRNWKALKNTLDQVRGEGHARLPNDNGTFSLGVAVGEPAHTGIAISQAKGEAEMKRLVALLHETSARIAAPEKALPKKKK